MSKRRVLAIGLDGYERTLGEAMMAVGELPALAWLHRESARFSLDHGSAQRTGLAWEHISSGLSPDAAQRWAAVSFDPKSYATWQEGTRFEPFPARLRARTVVFDTPYFDLRRAPAVRGLVDWGAHDPGTRPASRPGSLLPEFTSKFGAYPAKQWIYGVPWSSPERARKMGTSLTLATDVRGRAARWLLGERLSDWDLAIVVVSELHSAVEGLWHGVDPDHPLHHLPSARAAGDGLRSVYRAVDRLVGNLLDRFHDTPAVVFATGGMGPNRSDVASMVLLPELLYRHTFGKELFESPASWQGAPNGIAMLGEDESWTAAVNAFLPDAPRRRRPLTSLVRRVRARVSRSPGPVRLPLEWMPAARYQSYWHRMPAFALPSFYDGRIRINVAGRERHGVVPLRHYETACDQIEALLYACRDPLTGHGVVDVIERPGRKNPLAVGPTQSDLIVVWRGMPVMFDHPKFGRIGPTPYRRPGGHTGLLGVAYLTGTGLEHGDHGLRSTFDVVPTLVDLLGESRPARMSGESLFTEGRPAIRALAS